MIQWLTVVGMGLYLFLACLGMPEVFVYAATEPTYEYTEETSAVEAYVGTVTGTDSLNVRTGFGASYDKVQVNGSNVILLRGDRVAIMSSGNASNGSVWYEVRWVKNDIEYHGYVSGKYIERSEERAMPIATPTPEATPTPTATPTPIATPTPEITITPEPTETPKGEGGSKFWEGLLLIFLILLLFAVLFIIFMLKRREVSATKTTEKIDSLKNMQLKKQEAMKNAQRVNVMRQKVEDEDEEEERVSRSKKANYTDDVEMLARQEQARIAQEKIVEKSKNFDPTQYQAEEMELKKLSETLKEKEFLRDEIESLRPGDLVYHEIFGKGVVFDNSDVKRIEIRFGTDIRFIDKAGCVAKRSMHKI